MHCYLFKQFPWVNTDPTWCFRRLQSTSQRQDFFTNLVSKVKSGEVEMEEMAANASTLM